MLLDRAVRVRYFLLPRVAAGHGGGEPAHKFTHVTVVSREEHKVPVVRHECIGQDAHINELFGFSEECFKMPIVLIVVKDGCSTAGAVEDVVYSIADSKAGGAGQGDYYITLFVKITDGSLFPIIHSFVFVPEPQIIICVILLTD